MRTPTKTDFVIAGFGAVMYGLLWLMLAALFTGLLNLPAGRNPVVVEFGSVLLLTLVSGAAIRSGARVTWFALNSEVEAIAPDDDDV